MRLKMFKELINCKPLNTNELQVINSIEKTVLGYNLLDSIDLANFKIHCNILHNIIRNPYLGMLPMNVNGCVITRYGQANKFLVRILQILRPYNLLEDKDLQKKLGELISLITDLKKM